MPILASTIVTVAFLAAPVQIVSWLVLRHFEWANRIPWWVHSLFLGWTRPPFRILVPALFPPLLALTPLTFSWVFTTLFSLAFLAWRLLDAAIVEYRAGTPRSQLHMCETVRIETVWFALEMGAVSVLYLVGLVLYVVGSYYERRSGGALL
jgi:hypothetical protein